MNCRLSRSYPTMAQICHESVCFSEYKKGVFPITPQFPRLDPVAIVLLFASTDTSNSHEAAHAVAIRAYPTISFISYRSCMAPCSDHHFVSDAPRSFA